MKKGYSKELINQRLKTIEVRKDLTDEWGDFFNIHVLSGFENHLQYIANKWQDFAKKWYSV
ncbi:MAG: hypothetical protein K0B02_04490 [DPANN group archaeon]|nr:hypothetical protein [DPANN group archaeon]